MKMQRFPVFAFQHSLLVNFLILFSKIFPCFLTTVHMPIFAIAPRFLLRRKTLYILQRDHFAEHFKMNLYNKAFFGSYLWGTEA